MAAEPIRYFDRYRQALATEPVFGEGWLRFAYGNPLGRAGVWLLARRRLFSVLYGWQMNKRVSGTKVLPFIVNYDINVDEFVKSPYAFRTFNEFFCRSLKPECRPIAAGERVAVLPADGRHLAFPSVDAAGSAPTGWLLSDDAERGLARSLAGSADVLRQ